MMEMASNHLRTPSYSGCPKWRIQGGDPMAKPQLAQLFSPFYLPSISIKFQGFKVIHKWKLQNPIQNPNRTKPLTMGLKFYIIVNGLKFYIIVTSQIIKLGQKHQTNTNPKENICQNTKIKICMMERYQRTMNQVLGCFLLFLLVLALLVERFERERERET